MARVPETRYPTAISASYYRAMERLIKQMHQATLTQFQETIKAQASEYQRQDGPLDLIIRALEIAKSFTASVVFSASTLTDMAGSFVRNISGFNRKNVDQQRRVMGLNPIDGEAWLSDFVTASVSENVSLIKSIQEDYHKRVESIILQGVKNGKGSGQIATELKEAVGVSYRRAKFIARDQAGSITGQMTAKRHQQAGITRFKWQTSEDERVRKQHAEFNGNVYDYSNPPKGLLPGTDYNCRCVAIPVFKED